MWSLDYSQVPCEQETKESDISPSKRRLSKSNTNFFPENFNSPELFTSDKSQSDDLSTKDSGISKQSQCSLNSESENETCVLIDSSIKHSKDELSSSSSSNNRNEPGSEINQPNSNSEIDEDFVFVESNLFLTENKAKLKNGKF